MAFFDADLLEKIRTQFGDECKDAFIAAIDNFVEKDNLDPKIKKLKNNLRDECSIETDRIEKLVSCALPFLKKYGCKSDFSYNKDTDIECIIGTQIKRWLKKDIYIDWDDHVDPANWCEFDSDYFLNSLVCDFSDYLELLIGDNEVIIYADWHSPFYKTLNED